MGGVNLSNSTTADDIHTQLTIINGDTMFRTFVIAEKSIKVIDVCV